MINGLGGVLNAPVSKILELDHGLKVSDACIWSSCSTVVPGRLYAMHAALNTITCMSNLVVS